MLAFIGITFGGSFRWILEELQFLALPQDSGLALTVARSSGVCLSGV